MYIIILTSWQIGLSVPLGILTSHKLANMETGTCDPSLNGEYLFTASCKPKSTGLKT